MVGAAVGGIDLERLSQPGFGHDRLSAFGLEPAELQEDD